MSLSTYVDLIKIWAEQRNLIQSSTPAKQMLKMTEEVGELAAAVARGNIEKAADAIGDCFVVLTILAAQLDLTMLDCVGNVYHEISARKGETKDGIFVKEAE